MTVTTQQTGLEVTDLLSDAAFMARPLHPRDPARISGGLQQLTRAFVEEPQTILQVLVNTAVDLCGADSAGISLVNEQGTDENYWSWIATAGEYSSFLDASLPREPSACGLTLERERPQLFRVGKPFFDLMGIEAPLVLDGILLPWTIDGSRGTIWIMSHQNAEAFDCEDANLMQAFADFAAMAVRHQQQQRSLLKQAAATAAAAMANDLAHKINNPLQSLTNMLFLAAEAPASEETKTLAGKLSVDLARLSTLVGKLLEVPTLTARRS